MLNKKLFFIAGRD